MSKTYKIVLEFEVKATSYGLPATGPSYHSGGEPAEPPELEIEMCSIEGVNESIEKLYKKYREEKLSQGVAEDKIDRFDQFFADTIYDKVLDQAYQDDWEPDYDYDPTP